MHHWRMPGIAPTCLLGGALAAWRTNQVEIERVLGEALD